MQNITTICGAFKAFYSIGLLVFSIVIIMGIIATKETELSHKVSPSIAFSALWVAIICLSVIEGSLASLIGLAPVDREIYKDSHPIAYKITSIVHEGDNLQRYIIGRQFMVVLIVFVVNMSGAPVQGAELWGYPPIVVDIFLGSGLAMILFTCMVGQLNSQVNASHCMLDFINNYFALFLFSVAMMIEISGLLHVSYLVQMLVSWLSKKPVESKEEHRNLGQNTLFFGRCLMSLAILIFCFIVTLEALFRGQTTLWKCVPSYVAVTVFFVLMPILGMLEASHIAFFAAAKLRSSERGDSYFAMKTCEVLFNGEGLNLPAFMIGRQLCVVSCMLFVARVTSIDTKGGENIFGVPDGVQALLNTGFLGALIVTITGSIVWQLVAAAFPIAFLNNPITYTLLHLCLSLEKTGICAGAWILALTHKKLAGFNRDEVYIGTADERAEIAMAVNRHLLEENSISSDCV